MLEIGQIKLDVPFLQAPLSGYSDYAMRKLARDFGAPLTFAGVMLAKSAANPKVLKKPVFVPGDDEHPIGAQILGREPEIMATAASGLEQAGYDLIDLNFACPAPKVLARGRGGCLINEPEKAIEIYKRVRQAVSCPVTVKIRAGYDNSEQSMDNFWRIITALSEERVDAIIVHGRSVLQRFSGASDWEILGQIKREFASTTIIGSGDLLNAEAAANILKTGKIDGVLIARGAIGNPWIFSRLRALLEGKEPPAAISIKAQGQVIRQHLELVCQLYEKKKAVRYMRKFLVNYCRLHTHRKKVQTNLLEANSKDELLAVIRQWYELD